MRGNTGEHDAGDSAENSQGPFWKPPEQESIKYIPDIFKEEGPGRPIERKHLPVASDFP